MKEKKRVAMLIAAIMFLIQSIGIVAPVPNTEIKAKKVQTFVVYRGKSTTLSIVQNKKKVKPGKKYRYYVKNKKIATISKKGKVKGKKAGTTKVTLKKKSNNKKITIKIKVVDYVKELTLGTATNIQLSIGQSKSLRAVVYPKTAKNRKVDYISSNSAIVKVSSTGTVQALQSGFATITVKTKGTTKKGKKISKNIYILVPEDASVAPSSPVPTPNVPSDDATVGKDDGKEDDKPKTLEEAIKEIPTPDKSTLIAAKFVVKELVKETVDGKEKEIEKTSTMYFVNRNYEGTMHVTVDGMDMSSSSGVANVLHRLATEVTGKGVSISINPGNKKENKYYDEKLGLWRDAILVSRPDSSSAWLITNRKNKQQYNLMAWETDKKYNTPYGLIITDGDTTSNIVIS